MDGFYSARAAITSALHGLICHRPAHGGVHGDVQDFQRLHFGLGNARAVDISVTWPDGSEQTHKAIEANHIVEIRQGDDRD